MARLFVIAILCTLLYMLIVHKAPENIRRIVFVRYFGLISMGVTALCIVLFIIKKAF